MDSSWSSPAVLAVDEEDEEESLCEPEPLLLSCSENVRWWVGKLHPPEAGRRLLRPGVGGLQQAEKCDSAPSWSSLYPVYYRYEDSLSDNP